MHTIKSIFDQLVIFHSTMKENFGLVGYDTKDNLVYFSDSQKADNRVVNFFTISKFDTMADLNNVAAELYEQL